MSSLHKGSSSGRHDDWHVDLAGPFGFERQQTGAASEHSLESSQGRPPTQPDAVQKTLEGDGAQQIEIEVVQLPWPQRTVPGLGGKHSRRWGPTPLTNRHSLPPGHVGWSLLHTMCFKLPVHAA